MGNKQASSDYGAPMQAFSGRQVGTSQQYDAVLGVNLGHILAGLGVPATPLDVGQKALGCL